MSELSRTKRLSIAALVFAVIIVIGLVTVNRPDFEYAKSTQDVLTEAMASDYLLPVEDAIKMKDQLQFIDLRNQSDFIVGHIDDAINISTHSLLSEESVELLGDASKIFVLYGDGQLEANGPWMVLKQLGYDNVKVMAGGYEQFVKGGDTIKMGVARYDFAKEMVDAKKRTADAAAEAAKPVTVTVASKPRPRPRAKTTTTKTTPKPEKKTVKLAPKKVVEEEEEEEGC